MRRGVMGVMGRSLNNRDQVNAACWREHEIAIIEFIRDHSENITKENAFVDKNRKGTKGRNSETAEGQEIV